MNKATRLDFFKIQKKCLPDLSDFAIWATIIIVATTTTTIKIIPGIFQHVVI